MCEELRERFNLTEEGEEEVETAPDQKEKRQRTHLMAVPADPALVRPKWPTFLEAAAAALGAPVSDPANQPPSPSAEARAGVKGQAGPEAGAPQSLIWAAWQAT